MKVVSIAASCAIFMCSAYGDDVTIDWGKITDMQTDFSLNVKNLPEPPIKSADFSGHIQLDLLEKKLKMTVTGSMLAGPPPSPYYHNPLFAPGSEKHGKSEIVVDASTGTIGIRAQGAATVGPISVDANYCLVVKAPPQLLHLPAKSVMEFQLAMIGHKAQVMANSVPHTVEGGVVTYKSPPPPHFVLEEHYPYKKGEVQIHTDGVPIKFELHEECDEACLERLSENNTFMMSGFPAVDMSFANWQAGSGEILPFSCSEGSTMDISAYPHAMHVITAYDLMTQQLLDHPLTREFAALLPSTVPLVEEQIRLASRQQKDANIWPSALASLVAGMSGGAVVLALVTAFARKTQMSEPLLCEA